MELRERLANKFPLDQRIKAMLALQTIFLWKGRRLTTFFFVPFFVAPELWRPIFGRNSGNP